MRARTAGAQRGAGRARSAILLRRRKVVAGVVAAGILVGAFVALLPLLDDAIQEIKLPLRHEDVIRQQARDKDLDPALIAAVIYRESKFRDQTSHAGAKGLMQILPSTADYIARNSGGTEFEQGDLANPQINIAYGSWYLRHLIDHYRGNVMAAVAAYNAGQAKVDQWGGSELQLEDIGYPETRLYTEDVLDKRQEYEDAYARELGL